MNDLAWISIISLAGWLVLAGSAYASFQLSWSKTVRLVLLWSAIFAGGFVLAQLIGFEH